MIPAGKDAAMPGPKPVFCTFPDAFLQVARDTVRRRTAAVQTVQRFRLALLLHAQPLLANEPAAAAAGLSPRQVQRWRKRWAAGDFSVDDLPGRGRKATFSPPRPRRGPGHRLRSRCPNRPAPEPAVAGRPDPPGQRDVPR